ncbi:hypothetical protein TWF694_003141 [Orbilia ellipsospora]|uniref:von Willebrand domain-containing protein n=1 Tax=Orbilia ellipsospora TaxID=2528407 RepID=A0AAV9X112_9PEZI
MSRVHCGVYYIPVGLREPQPLPLLNLETEITLYPTYSRTVLRQHFKNISTKDAISEAKYVFPLHNTQTITSFTCHVGEDKTLNGIVQSKPKAKATYDAAIARGETAGLLSWAASDVWETKLGNIPTGASVEVVLTCVAQLQHDSEKDAIRFNLPTYVASRYGAPPANITDTTLAYSIRPCGRHGYYTILRGTNWVDIEGGMKIKVFVDMDAPIKMVEAPAHATNLRMGTHSTSDSSNEDFEPNKAVLTLSSDTTGLDKDFVVLVKTARSGHPSAVIQKHPTKDVASLMLTLVPKFNLPVAKPEVVFIVDRSGSMSGNETQLRKALAVFLQSLPVGCKFNICSFGSSHRFLWSKSKTYTEETLKEAQDHVSRFEADMGGTEMYPPVKDAIERRYKDINLELLLLTDGDIWQRDQLMDYVREQCKAKTVRMFTLGIGNGISHALIDGLASVGGGYSQVVQLEEKLDSKVVRMLRAALGQHVSDYSLEFPEAPKTADDDDFEMVEGGEPSKKVVVSGKKDEEPPKETKKISLFDTSADLDPPPEYESKDTDEARWSHLPPLPKLPTKLQSPLVIPPLFPFSRTNAYVVFDPAPKTLPRIAKLHAKTISGDDLELEIPVLVVQDGPDVSQLAARSFLQELEDGKGYLHDGLLASEGIVKDKQESKWDEIIEREGVRWGEGFGVASKWTSFVAVEEKTGKPAEDGKAQTEAAKYREEGEFERGALLDVLQEKSADLSVSASGFRRGAAKKKSAAIPFASSISRMASSVSSGVSGMFGGAAPKSSGGMPVAQASAVPISTFDYSGGYGSTGGNPRATIDLLSQPAEESLLDYSDEDDLEEEIDDGVDFFMAPRDQPSDLMDLSFSRESGALAVMDTRACEIEVANSPMKPIAPSGGAPPPPPLPRPVGSAMAFGAPPPPPPPGAFAASPAPPIMASRVMRSRRAAQEEPVQESKKSAPKVSIKVSTPDERIHSLIMLQSFAGSFTLNDDIATVIKSSFKTSGDILQKLKDLAAKVGVSEGVLATWAAILVFENGEGHASERDTWELVVEKAIMWLDSEGKNDEGIKTQVASVIGA